MSNRNIINYRDIIAAQLKERKRIVAFEMKDCSNVAELYNANNILAVAKTLQQAAVEIARLEGEMHVLEQLLKEEGK